MNQPVRVALTQGKSALIDSQDLPFISRWKWYARESNGTWYAARGQWNGKNNTIIKMHRVLLSAKKGYLVDHINHDTLDNTRGNLRLVTSSQNQMNRIASAKSGFKGVALTRNKKRYRTFIKIDGSYRHLGVFDEILEAARAYNRAAKEAFGDYAFFNPV